MSSRTLQVTDEIHEYLLKVAVRQQPVQVELSEETAQLEWGIMQISPEQGQFMDLFIKVMGARRVLEVGTFTGYSALAVALALPDDGEIICCDVSEEWTSIAKKYWEKAGVSDKIDLRLAPALETLDGLLADGQEGTFDFVFLDADKSNYKNYYERALKLLRVGGVIAIDNVLWSGKVVHPERYPESQDTQALHDLNAFLSTDERVDLCMLPMGDGLTLARKR